jgi:hypothetical protein
MGLLAPRLSVTTLSSTDLWALSSRITIETTVPSYNGLIPLNYTDENYIFSSQELLIAKRGPLIGPRLV